MKTLVSHCDYNSEKTPIVASCMMNGVWTNNNFLLGSNPPVGSIAFIARVVDKGGLGAEQLIKSLLLLFIPKKKL